MMSQLGSDKALAGDAAITEKKVITEEHPARGFTVQELCCAYSRIQTVVHSLETDREHIPGSRPQPDFYQMRRDQVQTEHWS